MITSMRELDVALTRHEPLPLLAIRGKQPPRHPLLGAKPEELFKPLDTAIFKQELASLVHVIRGESSNLPVLGALMMDSPQTPGSIAARTALGIEEVGQTVGHLTAAGLIETVHDNGVERVALTLPKAQ